eukprot:149458_1
MSSSSTAVNEENIWEIFTNISKLYDSLYIDEQDDTLCIASGTSNHNVCQVITKASQILMRQLHDNLDTNDPKCSQFLQWMCALSMSFSSPPINKLKDCLMGNRACVYRLLDILFIDILQKGLLFVNKARRKECTQLINSTDTNKAWLYSLIESVPYDAEQLLTPCCVKRLSKTLILMVNLILFIGAKPIISEYVRGSEALSSVLLYTLMQLLGTYVLPESIHMNSMTLPFHSAEYNTSYISSSKWKMQKSARISIQLHRLLIKCIWMMIHDIEMDVFAMVLRHEAQRVMMLQLMHFSVLSFECALDLLSWVCRKTYEYEDRESELLYRLVCNLGVSLVTLCDEYQLEGNEFKVNMFCATLTTEDEEEKCEINDDIIPPSAQKEKYITECGKQYEAYFSNVVRFANSIETIYTFHVRRAILTILPLISLCVSVRKEVTQRKEVIEFLKELFYVTLPQCSYLFIRFQYEAQYTIQDMIPILIKSRSGFNKENVFQFYQNESELQANCISSLHILLYLCDMDGVSCKTMIKNLDRTSKREWRNYVQNMSRFIQRFGSGALEPVYTEYDFKARLQSLIEFSKPKKVFSEKRHPDITIPLCDDLIIPQFEEYVQHGWMCNEPNEPPFKKRKLSSTACAHDEYVEEWPIRNILIKLSRVNYKSKSKKRKRTQYRIVNESHRMIYPDRYYSPCLQEMKLLTQWEPAVIKAQKEKKRSRVMISDIDDSEETQSEFDSSLDDDEYKPPNAQMKGKLKRRRSKRIRRKKEEEVPPLPPVSTMTNKVVIKQFLPDINKSFLNYNNNINISINNHYNSHKKAKKTAYEPYTTPHTHTQFNNDDMFKIDPRLNTRQMANHLLSCFEKQKKKTLFRILLIAENVKNDNVIRIDCEEEEEEDTTTSHLQESVYSAIKAIAFTNTRIHNKKIIFTAQMTKKKRVDLILDSYHDNSQLLVFFRRCDNKMNRIYVNSNDANNCTVHNLAKTIIAHLNEAKYIILVPNDSKSINIIVESMIVAHSAIKTQFNSTANQESYWLYCLLEANNDKNDTNSLPVLGQTNACDPFSSNWLFKIVMNNNYY